MRALAYQPFLTSLFSLSDASRVQPEPHGHGVCKAFPGTTAWPSEANWTKLNESIGGKLIRPGAPPGAVCHPGQPTFNSDDCASVTAAWSTLDFHSNHPFSNMWQQFNNDTCLVDPNTPCSGAGYPAYVVNATTAEDVKHSLEFAREHNVRVIVKSSGHDFQGRSQAPGSLSIWVHHMQGIEKTHDSFKPAGCDFTIDTPAVTVGGGTPMGLIYEELDKINQTVVGGNSKSVSVGGYLTGGGHSILGPRYGLAADHVLEMEVVTPMGDILIANECQNEDLFWAMRGGGGSTFGVMTSVTIATHPTPKVVAGIIAIVSPDNEASWIWDMVGYIASQYPYLTEVGVSGYAFTASNITQPGSTDPTTYTGMGGEFMILDSQDPNDMLAKWEPIFAHVKATWPEAYILPAVSPYPSFQSWFSLYYDQNPVGYDQYVGSRLLDEKALTTNITAVGQSFRHTSSIAHLVAGKGVRDAKPRGGSIAANPTWRKAIVHALAGYPFAPLSATAKAEALDIVNTLTEPWRQLAPDMGAYVNENNPAEPNWQETFWGENYERLAKIKRAVDPHDVLWCHPCVGNERWVQDGYRLCRV